ncbi:MAG TPA: class I SAM-dependent DNA methyltransferase [Chloroflexi bacterium]|nr:class I SAM-dependent DNA methyltransferase [Chloroflexota bacterium]
MTTTRTPEAFVATWRGNTSTERQVYQQHFLDLCALVGHPTPVQLDPENKFFTFEAGAAKQGGGNGYADVWYKGHFAIEYKGPHKSLDRAYEQLLQYRESLENPPLLITGNTQEFFIHTNFTNSVKQVIRVTLDDLLTPQGMQHIRNLFYNPDAFRPQQTAAQVTEEAAAHFARLADHLRKWGHGSHEIAHYLIRLLFCLFAEDIDLLPRELFTRLVDNGRRNPALFNRQVRQLFQAMAEGDVFGEHQVRYFDGGLFDDETVLDMDGDGVSILHGITQLDWSAIEPAIFGTLFTRSLDPAQRARLGAQYTSKEDILLIVEPVLMAPLRREWEQVKAQAQTLAAKRDAATTRGAATRADNELRTLLLGFAERLATIRVLDPACGSGNFLYVALRLLLDLWKEVAIFSAQAGLSILAPLPGLAPSPEQLYGIEINDYAHELAQATVWIGYFQWLHDNGYGFLSEPILKPLDNIKLMDAILAYDADGKPVEPEWPAAEVIVGNPPFLGNKRMQSELGAQYVHDLRQLFDGRIPGSVDLVAYWFERSRLAIVNGTAKRAGLLATQAIRSGTNRSVLDRIKESGDIFYAQSDRPWILDGAAVRVSMVGFDDGSTKERFINTNVDDVASMALENAVQVDSINSDLTASTNLTIAKRLEENKGLALQGPVKVGAFDIPAETAAQMLSASNLSGRNNCDVVRPWLNASDITGRNRHLFIIDFGDMSMEEASAYEKPFDYVREFVKPERDHNNRARRRIYWWQHGETVPALRAGLNKLARFISTPRVAKHRVFVWTDTGTLPDSRVYAIMREDDYFFGVLHSRVHEVWSLATSSRHGVGNDPTYNNTTCFETFPFPWPPSQEPADDPRVQAIAAAAADLVAQRDAWLNPPDGLPEKELQKRTLTNLYNARPAWLAAAHQRLDAAVLDAYGWPHDLSDEELLARLLALNLERAGVGK